MGFFRITGEKENKSTTRKKWIGSRLGWQLNEAELILKTVLEDESTTSRKYLQALVITYFKTKKEREINNETTN